MDRTIYGPIRFERKRVPIWLKLNRWLKRGREWALQDFIFIHISKDMRQFLCDGIGKRILFRKRLGICRRERDLTVFRRRGNGISRGRKEMNRVRGCRCLHRVGSWILLSSRTYWNTERWIRLLVRWRCRFGSSCSHDWVRCWLQRSLDGLKRGWKPLKWYRRDFSWATEANSILEGPLIGRLNQRWSEKDWANSRRSNDSFILLFFPLSTAISEPGLWEKRTVRETSWHSVFFKTGKWNAVL